MEGTNLAVAQRDREIIWRRFFFFESTLDRLSNEVCLDRRFRVFSACASTWNIRILKKPSTSASNFWKFHFEKKVKKSKNKFLLLLSVLRTNSKGYEASIWDLLQFHKYFPLLLPNIIISTFASLSIATTNTRHVWIKNLTSYNWAEIFVH